MTDQLPAEWITTKIGDIADKCTQRKPSDDEGFRYVDIGSIDRDRKVISEPQHLLGKDAPSRARKNISKGDVLVSLTRPNLNAVALVDKAYDGQIASTGFEVLKPLLIESKYLFAVVQSRSFIDSISGKVQGALYPAAKAVDVRGFDIPLPPLAEQKQIAAKLDELLAQVDTLKTRLDAIPAILKRFRQSVLAAAVSGRLTDEWRLNQKLEPVSKQRVRFEKVRTAKLDKEISNGNKETKRLTGKIAKHSFTIPTNVKIPETWIWTSFMDSMEKVVDCHNKTAPYVDEGIFLIRTPDIRHGRISLSNTKFVDQPTCEYWSRRCPPSPGDILFTREAPMGEAGIVPTDTKLCMGQRMMLLRPVPEFINPKYALFNIMSLPFQERMIESAMGTGVKHLRVADVESLTYPLAPIEEQTEIVRRVEQLFTFANQIEQRLKEAQSRVNHLTQSILAKAFRGELTAEWREQNPDLISGENSAQALLERIKTEQANLKPRKRVRKKSAA